MKSFLAILAAIALAPAFLLHQAFKLLDRLGDRCLEVISHETFTGPALRRIGLGVCLAIFAVAFVIVIALVLLCLGLLAFADKVLNAMRETRSFLWSEWLDFVDAWEHAGLPTKPAPKAPPTAAEVAAAINASGLS